MLDKISAGRFFYVVYTQCTLAAAIHTYFQLERRFIEFIPHPAQMKFTAFAPDQFPGAECAEAAEYSQKSQRFQKIAFAAAVGAGKDIFPVKKQTRPGFVRSVRGYL